MTCNTNSLTHTTFFFIFSQDIFFLSSQTVGNYFTTFSILVVTCCVGHLGWRLQPWSDFSGLGVVRSPTEKVYTLYLKLACFFLFKKKSNGKKNSWQIPTGRDSKVSSATVPGSNTLSFVLFCLFFSIKKNHQCRVLCFQSIAKRELCVSSETRDLSKENLGIVDRLKRVRKIETSYLWSPIGLTNS